MKFILTCARLSLALLLFAFLGSCSKEKTDPAPAPTPEQNLATSWRLAQYLRNGVDETSQLVIRNYEETYANPSTYSRSYLDENGQAKSETGRWGYERDRNRLSISSVSSVKVTRNAGSVSSAYYDIQKLDATAFWYSFTNGSDRHEFRFVKK